MLAVVLNRRDWRENDQIISLYTREQGKLELLARGVKKIISKQSAHLEPFSLVDIIVEPGKELDHLTQVYPVNFFSQLRKNLAAGIVAGKAVGLVSRLSKIGEKDERIFALLVVWLDFINQNLEADWEFLFDGLIIKLLYYLGWDIVEDEKIPLGIKEELLFLRNSEWLDIVGYQVDQDKKEKIKQFIQQFAEWHSG